MLFERRLAGLPLPRRRQTRDVVAREVRERRELGAAGVVAVHRPVTRRGGALGEEGTSGIRYLLDPRVADGSGWITGANADGKHVFGLVAGRDFGNDGAQTTMPQTLFEEGQQALLIPGFDVGHAVRRQTSKRQGWRKEVLAHDAPEDRAFGPRDDPSSEKSCRSPIESSVTSPGDFMQCSNSQATTRKPPIDLG